jgi:hypothetical protein
MGANVMPVEVLSILFSVGSFMVIGGLLMTIFNIRLFFEGCYWNYYKVEDILFFVISGMLLLVATHP